MNNDYREKLLQSKKYRDVCPDTLVRLWAECEVKYKKPKDVDRAVREALHGITGAFLTPAEASECAWAMQSWHAGGRTDAQLENILNKHASTRERLPLADMDALSASARLAFCGRVAPDKALLYSSRSVPVLRQEDADALSNAFLLQRDMELSECSVVPCGDTLGDLADRAAATALELKKKVRFT